MEVTGFSVWMFVPFLRNFFKFQTNFHLKDKLISSWWSEVKGQCCLMTPVQLEIELTSYLIVSQTLPAQLAWLANACFHFLTIMFGYSSNSSPLESNQTLFRLNHHLQGGGGVSGPSCGALNPDDDILILLS